jgi:hypothetical protein
MHSGKKRWPGFNVYHKLNPSAQYTPHSVITLKPRKSKMGQQLTPYESISYELNQFIERRVAERRAMQRDSSDRRKQAHNTHSGVQDAGQGDGAGAPAARDDNQSKP